MISLPWWTGSQNRPLTSFSCTCQGFQHRNRKSSSEDTAVLTVVGAWLWTSLTGSGLFRAAGEANHGVLLHPWLILSEFSHHLFLLFLLDKKWTHSLLCISRALITISTVGRCCMCVCELQLRKFLHQIGLGAFYWLIDVGRSSPTVGGTNPEQVGLGYII